MKKNIITLFILLTVFAKTYAQKLPFDSITQKLNYTEVVQVPGEVRTLESQPGRRAEAPGEPVAGDRQETPHAGRRHHGRDRANARRNARPDAVQGRHEALPTWHV